MKNNSVKVYHVSCSNCGAIVAMLATQELVACPGCGHAVGRPALDPAGDKTAPLPASTSGGD